MPCTRRLCLLIGRGLLRFLGEGLTSENNPSETARKASEASIA